MYSVIDKASFQRAEDELSRLQDFDLLRSRPAILVANKVDLARSRAVSSQGTGFYYLTDETTLQRVRDELGRLGRIGNGAELGDFHTVPVAGNV